MQKKTLLQISILAMIVGILIFFYQSYNTGKNTLNKTNAANDDEKNINNLIYNIEYIAEGKNDMNYVIKSDVGELNNDNPEQILMKKVIATINIKDSEPIIISSDFALYNSTNFNTKFYENVLMSHQIHAITSDNLDLLFEVSLATISNNVIYKNLNTRMQADKIEIDLITKNSKIFMDNKTDKVKIVNIN